MKKLLLAGVLLLVPLSAQADIIVDLGVNPNSGTGAFSNTNPGSGGGGSGSFNDNYLFQLVGGPTFITIASVTNVYASLDQFIANFQGAVLLDANNNGVDPTDPYVIGPANATACPVTPSCQGFDGSAILAAGNYYLQFTGIAGENAGYGGNLSTAPLAVPGPVVGAGFPGIMAGMVALWGLAKRRRNRAHA